MKAEKVYYEMERLTFEEVKDILVVCTILSTSGGGDLNKELFNNCSIRSYCFEKYTQLS